MDGLYDLSTVPHTIKYKVDRVKEERNNPGFEIEEIWLQQNKI